MQTLLHTDAFTHRRFYRQTLVHKHLNTQRLLHTDAFTRRPFYQRRFYRNTFTRRHFYPQTLLHTEAFTHRRFYTQKRLVFGDRTSFRAKGLRLDAGNRNFTPVFGDRTSFRAKGLRLDAGNRNFTSRSFWRSNFISCERVADWTFRKSQFYLMQFLAIEPHFVRKGCDRTPRNCNFTSCSFWRSNLISCERVATGTRKSQFLPQFLAIKAHFVRQGCAGTPTNRNFTPVFGNRTSFRAKGLRFVPSRWHCPAPSREK